MKEGEDRFWRRPQNQRQQDGLSRMVATLQMAERRRGTASVQLGLTETGLVQGQGGG